MIAIIDYDAGNLKSVEKALLYLGQDVLVTRDREKILSADKVILPGVAQLIVSASPQETLERQVESLGVRGRFQALLGLSDIYAGSKAGLARQYFAQEKISPDQVLFVGDTLHDWEVAEDAGCHCVLLSQGHQSRRLLEKAGVPVVDTLEQAALIAVGNERCC